MSSHNFIGKECNYLRKRKLGKLIERKKYLGLLKADGVKDSMIKERMTKKYIRRIRKILKSKLNGVSMILAITSCSLAAIRRSAGVSKWTKEELQQPISKDEKVIDDIPGIGNSVLSKDAHCLPCSN